ncbi:MAG: hypothetical protein K6E42_03480 [Synergistes sp.]|nr:hypothetical protein [Synergistes sp.]
MQATRISITTDKIKKGKLDTKEMDAQIIEFEDRRIFGINPFRRDLNKNQHFKVHIGCMIKYDNKTYVATRIDETDEPIHQLIHAVPLEI